MLHDFVDFLTRNWYDDYINRVGIYSHKIWLYIEPCHIMHAVMAVPFIFVIGPCLWHFFVTTFKPNINMAVITGLFYESENETGNANDYKLLCDQVAVLLATIFLTVSLLYKYPKHIASPMVVSTVTWSVYILTIPAIIMSLFGAYFLNYLKGDSDSGSGIKNSVVDFANLFGFFKRFAIQMIRYVLVTVKIGLFVTFCGVELAATRKLFIIDCRERWRDTYIEYMVDNYVMLWMNAIHVVVELTNVFIIYYAQLGAFVIILYWLLNSLFSNAWPIIKLLWMRRD